MIISSWFVPATRSLGWRSHFTRKQPKYSSNLRQPPIFGRTRKVGDAHSLWAIVGITSVFILSCHSDLNGWNGRWELNESKSSAPGPNVIVSLTPTGEYHIDTGTYSYNFACNGKEYPATTNRTITCTPRSSAAIDTISKANGAAVESARWQLSSDGKMLTITVNSIRPKGLTRSRESAFIRTSATSGFVGAWKTTKPFPTNSQVLVLALKDGRLHIAFPESGQYTDPPLDGSDAAMNGPGIVAGLTMAVRPNGLREFITLKKNQGRIIASGSLKLSDDGRTLTEEFGDRGPLRRPC